MARKSLDLSTTQLVAGGMATLAAAVGASFLGVYGTVIGAAFMSVISTAGTALGNHYLERGREQVRERTRLHDSARDGAAARAAGAAAVSADPTRTVVLPPDFAADADPNATRFDGPAAGGGDPGATRADLSPAETVADDMAGEAGHEAVREAARRGAFGDTLAWARRRWAVLAVSSIGVFAVVMAGITVMEKITDRPASSWVGANDGRGTTWANLGGRGQDGTPTPEPGTTREGDRPGEAPTSGGPDGPAPEERREPTRAPTSGPEAPTNTPERPAETTQPTQAPTTRPAPTGAPDGGGGQGQDAPVPDAG